MLMELFQNAMHSTLPGFVGVTLIFVYFVFILCTAGYRIRRGEHLQH